MKIIVSGGAGFIASHIVDAYISLGHSVVVLDNLSTGKKEYVNPKAKLYEVDIRNKADVEKIFTIEEPQLLNHHAAQMSVRKSVEDPQFDAQVNILGLLNLLQAGQTVGLKKIILASSGGAVYGDALNIPTPEEYEPKIPLSPYGVTKLASEYYLHYYFLTYNMQYIALRYSNVYGPRQNPHGEAGVVAIFSQKLVSKQIPVINGDGKQTRDYIYVEDVVSANIQALNTSYCGAVNIGTSKEIDVNHLFESIRKIAGLTIEPVFAMAKKGEQMRSCVTITKAKNVLNWEPKVSLEVGLEKTYQYFFTKK